MMMELNIISVGYLVVFPALFYIYKKEADKENAKPIAAKLVGSLIVLYLINLTYIIHNLKTLHH